MKDRSIAREFIFKFLYQKLFNDSFEMISDDDNLQLHHFKRVLDYPVKESHFINNLIDTVKKSKDEIDHLIIQNLQQWTIKRISKIDRTIITLGIAEMKFLEKPTPSKIVINECVELSKKYGQENSKSFVNGILDKISHS